MRVFSNVLGVGTGEAPEFAEFFCGSVKRRQLIGIRKFERLEKDTVDDGEHDGGGADAEREDEERDDGEARLLAEGAEGVAGVLRKIFEPAGAAGVAAFFFDLFGAAEGEAGAAMSFFGSGAGGDQVLLVLFDVEEEFFVELRFHFLMPEKTCQPVHFASPSAFERPRIRETASVSRFQLASSWARADRPLRVSL